MKKLEGLFGLKLGEVFEEKDFKITKKELIKGEYYIDIDWPPKPNNIFKDYGIICDEKDMKIKSIDAKTLSPIPFDEAMERYEDIANFFIETYLESYAIYHYEGVENFVHLYEFIPYDSKIIPFRRDYSNFVHPNEPTKQLLLALFGQSDYYKQVEIDLSLKDKDIDGELKKIYEEEDIETFDTGKGYEIDVTGL